METWHSDDLKAFFFFLSQILHFLPQTLQRLQRQLDFGKCQAFEMGHTAVGMLFRVGVGGWFLT